MNISGYANMALKMPKMLNFAAFLSILDSGTKSQKTETTQNTFVVNKPEEKLRCEEKVASQTLQP